MGNKECRVLSFGVVQAHRTSSNLLEPHHHRDSKVWRGLSQEFDVLEPPRTSFLIKAHYPNCKRLATIFHIKAYYHTQAIISPLVEIHVHVDKGVHDQHRTHRDLYTMTMYTVDIARANSPCIYTATHPNVPL